ncbi:5-amino-6-(5-phosphoribosylamino)uracil reductase [Methylorubrum populi]|uniref:dihydrofolate reductase family protein n=1 Tax=Methylorubrum populi TaxID=223967 RepID=UPI00114FEECB|nr:dihydrofolate reductase family protein [Methylorubrum populi]QDI80098.1 5-amino-6-(5-phosphoribosylamino)uracil reductase [Methylorubrum populi]
MRPYVICHMMGPLDGELLVDRWSPSTGRPAEALIAEYDRVHEALEGDAWIAGRAVGAEFAEGQPHPPEPVPAVERPLHVARAGAEEYAVLIDPHGKLHWTGPETYGAPLVMVLGRDVPDAHLAELAADGISYIVSEQPEVDLGRTLEALSANFGVRRLILEGGAHTNAAFLKAGLVDEISLVLFPAIGGHSGSQTLFEAGEDGLADRVRLSLVSAEVRQAGAVALRYRVAYPPA